jgi:hypothetical protein
MKDEMSQTVDAIQDCLASLLNIQQSFRDVVDGVNRTKTILKALNTIIGGVTTKSELGDIQAPSVMLSDREYFSEVSSLFRTKKSGSERLRILVILIGKVQASKDGWVDKFDKLNERIKLQPSSPERQAAIKLKAKVAESIKIMDVRLKRLIDIFFKTRHAMLMNILGSSEEMLNHLRDSVGCVDTWIRDDVLNYICRESFYDTDKNLLSNLKSSKKRIK